MEKEWDLVPKWLWRVLLISVGVLAIVATFVTVTGIGGQVFGNLAPEGYFSDSPTSQTSGQTASISGQSGKIRSFFRSEWVISASTKWHLDNHGYIGTDFVPKDKANADWTLVAPIAGTVTFVGDEPDTYGNYLKIKGEPYSVLMAHFEKIDVQQGQEVGLGDPLGKMGSTGDSTGPHLHFEVYDQAGKPIDPETVVSQDTTSTGAMASTKFNENYKGIFTWLANLAGTQADDTDTFAEPEQEVEIIPTACGCCSKKTIKYQEDQLVVLIFTREGDPGTKPLKPYMNSLSFLYPWIDFIYVDVDDPRNEKWIEQFEIDEIPTTVLARSGREVWTWEGNVEGLAQMLDVHRELGEMLMASGDIPFIGPAGELPNVTFAGVYGALCATKGTLGTLGKVQYPLGSGNPIQACSVDGALNVAAKWGQWVREHNNGKTVVNVLMPTIRESSSDLISQIIAETGRRNAEGEFWYVMLDLQSDSEFDSALQRYVTAENPHVGIIFDVEWFGKKVAISSINNMAERYFSHRQQLGLRGLGIVGVWYFDPTSILADEPVTREWEKDLDLRSNYSTGIVVPIMDGHGNASAKLAKYDSMMKLFKPNYAGMMGFTWRWGSQYDSAQPEEIFREDMLFWTQQ